MLGPDKLLTLIVFAVLTVASAAAAVWLAAGGCLGWPHAVVWVALAVRSLVMPLRQWKLAGERRPMPPRTLGRTEMLFTAAFLITIAL